MKLLNGGTIGASIPQAGKSIDVEPQGCIRIEMAKKHTHNDVILTDDEAVEFCREVMNLLSLKERAAYAETRRAVQEIAEEGVAPNYQNDADDYGVYAIVEASSLMPPIIDDTENHRTNVYAADRLTKNPVEFTRTELNDEAKGSVSVIDCCDVAGETA